MPRIRCKGVASLVHRDPAAKVEFDRNGRFFVVPGKLADRYVSQTDVPILLEHNDRYRVGTVTSFYRDDVTIDGISCPALMADFVIDKGGFIAALQNVCQVRFADIAPAAFTSSDGFVKGGTKGDFDLNAFAAILQRVPGLSLGHNGGNLDITELSMCVSGARPGTVITDAEYDGSAEGVDESEDEKLAAAALYTTFFAGLHSLSNGFRFEKVERDLASLNVPKTCLVYTHDEKEETKREKEPIPASLHIDTQTLCSTCAAGRTKTDIPNNPIVGGHITDEDTHQPLPYQETLSAGISPVIPESQDTPTPNHSPRETQKHERRPLLTLTPQSPASPQPQERKKQPEELQAMEAPPTSSSIQLPDTVRSAVENSLRSFFTPPTEPANFWKSVVGYPQKRHRYEDGSEEALEDVELEPRKRQKRPDPTTALLLQHMTELKQDLRARTAVPAAQTHQALREGAPMDIDHVIEKKVQEFLDKRQEREQRERTEANKVDEVISRAVERRVQEMISAGSNSRGTPMAQESPEPKPGASGVQTGVKTVDEKQQYSLKNPNPAETSKNALTRKVQSQQYLFE